MGLFVLSLSLAVCVFGTYGLPTGAPTAACADMAPQHNDSASTEPSPYTVTVTGDGDAGYTVEVSGDVPFKGVLLQARAEGDTTALGAWSEDSDDLQTIPCGEDVEMFTAVTHTNNNDKESITATWMPVDGQEATYIVATVVQAFGDFWTGIETPLP